MSLEFEEFMKGILPTVRTMGITEMDIWKTSNYGESDKYLIIMPARSPQQMDAELAAPQFTVPIGIVPVTSALNRMLVSWRDVLIIPKPELNRPPAEGYEMKLR